MFVVLKSEYIGKEPEIARELIALCKKELPEYTQPVKFRFQGALLLNPIGKIDYRALEKETEKIETV